MIALEVEPKKLTIKVNIQKTELKEFYHIVFAPRKKIQLSELPLPYLVNDKIFFLVDVAIYKLFELPNDLIIESHDMWQSAYMMRIMEKYPGKFKSETEMLVCKFSKQL